MPIMPHIVNLSASDLGLSSVALSATTNGSWCECRGAQQLRIDFDIVNATAAALPLVWYFDTKMFDDASTVIRYEMIGSDNAPGGTTVITDLYRRQWRYTTAAGAATYRFFTERAVTFGAFRVSGVTAAGAGVGDLVSVSAALRYGG